MSRLDVGPRGSNGEREPDQRRLAGPSLEGDERHLPAQLRSAVLGVGPQRGLVPPARVLIFCRAASDAGPRHFHLHITIGNSGQLGTVLAAIPD